MLLSRASLFFSVTLAFSAALALPIVDSSNRIVSRTPGDTLSRSLPGGNLCMLSCIQEGNHSRGFCQRRCNEGGDENDTSGDDTSGDDTSGDDTSGDDESGDDDTSNEDDTSDTSLPAPDNAACVSVCLNAGLKTGPDAPAQCQDFCNTESES